MHRSWFERTLGSCLDDIDLNLSFSTLGPTSNLRYLATACLQAVSMGHATVLWVDSEKQKQSTHTHPHTRICTRSKNVCRFSVFRFHAPICIGWLRRLDGPMRSVDSLFFFFFLVKIGCSSAAKRPRDRSHFQREWPIQREKENWSACPFPYLQLWNMAEVRENASIRDK